MYSMTICFFKFHYLRISQVFDVWRLIFETSISLGKDVSKLPNMYSDRLYLVVTTNC